jgi:hypothetical protein
MIDWEGFGSGSGLILRYYPSIRLDELRNTMKTAIRIVSDRGRDFKPRLPENEAGVLTTTFGKKNM